VTNRGELHVRGEIAFGGRSTVYPIHRAGVLGLAAGCLFLSTTASAKLGGAVSSVTADRGRMAVRMNSVAMGRYTRHDLTRANGGLVHEFTNADGKVFAVTWSGPGKPDLSTLLGPYFSTFQANSIATARQMHALRRPPQVAQRDLQIQAGGHMGWFHGVAFVPSLAPAGFSVDDLAVQP
jgi:hypothetical protein